MEVKIMILKPKKPLSKAGTESYVYVANKNRPKVHKLRIKSSFEFLKVLITSKTVIPNYELRFKLFAK